MKLIFAIYFESQVSLDSLIPQLSCFKFLDDNQEQKFWARLVAYDYEGLKDSDAAYFKTAEGQEVRPKWRAELIWVGPESEPRARVRVFHVEHPDTKVVKIELIPNSFLFKFDLDGATQVGRLSPEKVLIGEKRFSKFQIR